ncbi:hypothetical protein H072_9878 [Dactylellina haptotyla CBS 200.50]|uniref:Uncharacterized protein n=1 Tax=Dactylellina haptotyla (strain CBS 200.50) TaxID=1284197 RepID=S8A1G0_DACHA|nr:hypothetical protein H072_9878 [Dactylellina haptotyla CBS 200.50]
MSSDTRDRSLLAISPTSPSGESTMSSPIDPSSARMRILVAPYYSPYVVSVDKAQTWEGLILMLQRLFGPTFCSLEIPPRITLFKTEESINSENWEHIVCADCCIVVHTKSEDTGSSSQNTSPRPTTSGSTTIRERLAPKSRDVSKNEISGPTASSPKEQKARLINRHANSGFDTPNLFDSRNFTPGVAQEPAKEKPTKRKRRETLWNTVLNVISIVTPGSSSNATASRPQQPVGTGPITTHISAMERTTSRKLSQRRRAKTKRTSRVIMQAPTGASVRPTSITRPPLKPKFSAGNIMRMASRRQSTKKRRSIPPPAQNVRRHIAKSGSDCSTCFGDDKNRDSVVVAARPAGEHKPSTTVTTTPSPPTRNINSVAIENRLEKTDSIAIFSSPVIEEFSLQPKKKARPPSSAAATKTSSIYYEASAPPIPCRTSLEETGFNAQYKLLDEKIVRNVVYKAVAAKKAEEAKTEDVSKSARSSHRSEASSRSQQSSKSNRTTYPEKVGRTSVVTPKRSKSMAAGASPNLSTLRRSGTTSPSHSARSGSVRATIDNYYTGKHSSTGSRAGTVRSSGSTGGFVRHSTPFDNKPLPRLPDEASNHGSVDLGRNSTSAAGGILMPPIATFEDLMSKTNSITESVEISSIKQITMVAGHPELH